MSEYVELYFKRNRGWPWPEDSWGLTPMFGEDGWCRSCGVPKHAQTGSVVLQRKGMKVEGGWVPNWQFDAICLERSVAEEVASRFDVELLKVDWHGPPPGDAMQIVVPSIGESWFDHDELRDKAIERHGVAGATCPECGVWRWMPLAFGMLPPLRITPGLGDADIAASPEWFGDGWKAYRQILVRRELAELITAASSRDFKVQLVS
jgi:hypothetical protein